MTNTWSPAGSMKSRGIQRKKAVRTNELPLIIYKRTAESLSNFSALGNRSFFITLI